MGVTQSVVPEQPEELPASIMIPTRGRAPPPDLFDNDIEEEREINDRTEKRMRVREKEKEKLYEEPSWPSSPKKPQSRKKYLTPAKPVIISRERRGRPLPSDLFGNYDEDEDEDLRKSSKYCKTSCFPTTKIGVNTWKLGSEIPVGEPSAFGIVFEACSGEDCDHVLKCMSKTNEKQIKNEIKMMNLCAAAGLCMPVADSWICDDKKGGAIIMPRLDISLKTKLKATSDEKEQWDMIKQALYLIRNLHKVGIRHGDSHTGNFMFDKQGKLMFIDMGQSKLLSRDVSTRFKNISRDYNKLRISLHHLMQAGNVSPNIYNFIDKKINNALHEIKTENNGTISSMNKLEGSAIGEIISIPYSDL